jgi:hypothetical protein
MSRGLLTLEVYESMRVDRLGQVHMLVVGVVVRAAEWCVYFGFLHSFAVPRIVLTGPSLVVGGPTAALLRYRGQRTNFPIARARSLYLKHTLSVTLIYYTRLTRSTADLGSQSSYKPRAYTSRQLPLHI